MRGFIFDNSFSLWMALWMCVAASAFQDKEPLAAVVIVFLAALAQVIFRKR